MKLHPYLNYGGNCAEAFRFYEEHLGGKILAMMTHEGVPPQPDAPPGWEKAILYANMSLGGTQLMGNDVPPGRFEPMRSAYLSIEMESVAEAERAYAVLSPDAEIFMPMQETFFAHRFAMLRDRFGTSWMILHQKAMPQG